MIKLSEDFRLSFEVKNNVTLEQKYIVADDASGKESKRKGEVSWKQIGYHSAIKSAIKQYIEIELQKSDCIESLLKRLSELEIKIEALFRVRFSPFYTF